MLLDGTREAIIKATKSSVPISTYRPHVRPFWDKELDQLHKEQFNLRRTWIAQDRPRGMEHSSYANYKHAKRRVAKMFRDKQVTFIRSENKEGEMRGTTDIKHLWRHVKPKTESAAMSAIQNDGTLFLILDPCVALAGPDNIKG